jgi:hypothetical protein
LRRTVMFPEGGNNRQEQAGASEESSLRDAELAHRREESGMNEHAGMSLSRPLDQDSDHDSVADPSADPSRAKSQAEWRAGQESALQRWETEGGAVDATSRQRMEIRLQARERAAGSA